MLMCLSQGLWPSRSSLSMATTRSRPFCQPASQPHASVIYGVYESYWPGYHPIALLPHSGT